MGLIKTDKIDKVFSLLVRERPGWVCECCGKYYPEGQRQGLHCSHIFSRRHKATRWDPSNAAAHCFSCHQRLGGDPVEFHYWAQSHLGSGPLEIVREKAHSIVRLRKHDLEDIYRHLKSEYDRMMKLRANGETGRIEFEAPL